jgi:hypothetical protein
MKAHLIDTAEPLKEGSDVEAICGELVRNVVFAYMFDSVLAPEFVTGMNTINTCRTCYRIPLNKQYVYGLLPGAEIRPEHESAEAAA